MKCLFHFITDAVHFPYPQINARARYGLAFGGACPDLFLQEQDSFVDTDASLDARTSVALHPTQKKWTVYLPKAYHPLLLQKHQQALQKALKDVKNANAVKSLSISHADETQKAVRFS